MDDKAMTKERLISELAELRQQIAELETLKTKHKKAEEALQEAEKRYQSILDGMMEGCQIINSDWRYVYVNDAVASHGRHSKDELLGHTMMDMYPGIEDTEMFAQLRQCMEKRTPHRMENEFAYPNGAKGWFELSIEPAAEGILVLSTDITERKQAEERIQHLNLVLRAVRNVNQLIVREKDRSRLLQSVCKNIVETPTYHDVWVALLDERGRLLTYAKAGLGDDFLPLAERLKQGELPACGQRALRQSEVVVTEDPFSTCTDCPLAKKHEGRAAMAVRLEYGGKIYGLLSVSVPAAFITGVEEQSLFREVAGDISFALRSMELEEERKQAERELKEAKERLAGIVDGVAIPTFVVDKGHKVTRWNAALEALSDVKEEQVIGTNKQWRAFYSQERPIMADLIVDGASENEFVKYYQGKHKQSPLIEGAYEAEDFFPALGKGGRWLRFTAAPVKDEAGEVIAAVETLEDITEHKQVEEALRQSEEKYRLLANNVRDVIWTVDMNLRPIYVSPSIMDLLGYSVEERLAGSIQEALTTASLEVVTKAFEEELATESSEQKDLSRSMMLELELQRKDGSTSLGGGKSIFPA